MNKVLQQYCGVAFRGLNARLDQQCGGVDPGLLQRQLETIIFGRQGVLERLVPIDDPLLLFGVSIGFQQQGFGVGPRLLKLVSEFFILLGKGAIFDGESRQNLARDVRDHRLQL